MSQLLSFESGALQQLAGLLWERGNALELIDSLTQSAYMFLNNPGPLYPGVIVFGGLLNLGSYSRKVVIDAKRGVMCTGRSRGEVLYLPFERLVGEVATGHALLDASGHLFQQLDPAFEVLDSLGQARDLPGQVAQLLAIASGLRLSLAKHLVGTVG